MGTSTKATGKRIRKMEKAKSGIISGVIMKAILRTGSEMAKVK